MPQQPIERGQARVARMRQAVPLIEDALRLEQAIEALGQVAATPGAVIEIRRGDTRWRPQVVRSGSVDQRLVAAIQVELEAMRDEVLEQLGQIDEGDDGRA